MSLRIVVAAPFRQRGRDRLEKSEFVVAVSLDRDWFSPDQAERVVEVATDDGLLSQNGDFLVPTFDPDDVTIPADFNPDKTLLRNTPPFERILKSLVSAGFEKQSAVADINRLQDDLSITLETAAVLYARRNGVDVEHAAKDALDELAE